MDGSIHPALADRGNGYVRATNVILEEGLPRTRNRVVTHRLTGDTETFQTASWRGGAHYNPALGTSQQIFGTDKARVLGVCGGSKLDIEPTPTGYESRVTDVSGGFTSGAGLHLAWVSQAENYVLVSDGENKLWVWDGENDPFESDGLKPFNKPESKLANGSTANVYAYGRVSQAINGSQISVGDFLHKTELSDSVNILDTTEQQYWETGSFFSPPSSLGNILAMEVLPLRDTTHGHGAIMVHCENGIFSLDLSNPNRARWAELPITRLVNMRTGARGPYAVAVYDGDQVFRSRHGVQSIRSAAAESDLLGSPLHPISEEVAEFFDADFEPYLRFASVCDWHSDRRLLCSFAPRVEGTDRWHRGLVSLNFRPLETERTTRSWEGAWTFPKPIAGVVQNVSGVFGERERFFGVHVDEETKTQQLVEYTQQSGEDILPDGSSSPISCQLVSHELTLGDTYATKVNRSGSIHFRRVEGDLDWGVWYRTEHSPEWKIWGCGKIRETDADDELAALTGGEGIHRSEPLPHLDATGRKVQFLVRWRGVASLEGLRVFSDRADAGSTTPKAVNSYTYANVPDTGYDDFEYSRDPRWEDIINAE